MKTKHRNITLIILFLLLGIYLYSHYQSGDADDESNAVAVTLAPVIKQDTDVTFTAIGQVQALATVNVTAQVTGQLTQVGFNEGDNVKQGQLLFQIDPRPYQAQLAQAEANLASAQAQLWNYRLTVERYAPLLKKGYVSKQDYDQAKANADAQAATVEADQAAVTQAKLNLTYCTITAPISGRTGDLLVDVGNLVTANSTTPLVTINQLQPIYISFTVPERQLPAIQAAMQQHALTATVKVSPQKTEQGQINFVNNAVDNTTGTIQLKATFNNADEQLWPGQFVHVILPLQHLPQALIIPAIALQEGQQGTYVYVVGKDKVARYRLITAGPNVANGVVVERGLKAGEQVVTAGQLRLQDGTKIMIASKTD